MDDHRNTEEFIEFVEICIHKARDLHNICIYQDQDVYAKLCLTNNEEKKISSKVVNGGGTNPIFDETMRFNIPKMDSLLRCEIWMLSRIKNYLEDQLLGFALIPLSDIVSESRKEFELSSSELFHSPAGFIQLSFKYSGITSREAVALSRLSMANVAERVKVSCDLDRIEFPDQEMIKENERMVSEYLNLESVCDNVPLSQGRGVLGTLDVRSTAKPVIDVKVELEEKVVQEEIVDMYMKGMQQFVDALAKMKLPADIGGGPSVENDIDSGSDGKLKSPPRVFYGSRAFF